MIQFRLILLLLPIIGALAAIRCYTGQETHPGQGMPFTSVDCPMASYCFKSYTKRRDDSYSVTKSCGDPGKCFKEGCEGSSDEQSCCCSGDLCNSTSSLATGLVLLLTFFRVF
ncbi:hypothetical protein KIN20_021043 [Parelaphostrongylus tenuis]|uniref:Uncharacterized protein n=1 Tax=Parelaphostrongylus tenuis TaxID=148309 RepID=A0AAD5MS44_PARTN|nr:hypothetical protein KIN20_021043 [Parelaphostrongylus tenuis]